MVRVLLTGATGYVGGETLHQLTHSAIPNLRITCIVRDSSKAEHLEQAYVELKTIVADLDDTSAIQSAAEATDIVLHLAATGHAGSASAIVAGLSKAAQDGRLRYWIQIGGASVFAAEEIAQGRYGQSSDQVYDDGRDEEIIRSIIKGSPKRVVEQTVIAQDPQSVKTALLIGPLIYGIGRGLFNKTSMQLPGIAKATSELGHGFRLNAGLNAWSNVHVKDVADLVIKLVEAAVNGTEGLWNDDGIYCVEGGEATFGEICKLTAQEAKAQGLVRSSDVEEINAARADELSDHAAVLWGTNARLKSSRARSSLGWEPPSTDLTSEIVDVVRAEAQRRSAFR